MNFQDYFNKLRFGGILQNIRKIFLNWRNAILLNVSSVLISSDYAITIWYSYLYVLMSELIQNKSALNQRCSALKTLCFRVRKISVEHSWIRADFLWNSAEFFTSQQRWFRESQSWSALKQCWSVLMFFVFSESALKNVQRWLSLRLQPGLPNLNHVHIRNSHNKMCYTVSFLRRLQRKPTNSTSDFYNFKAVLIVCQFPQIKKVDRLNCLRSSQTTRINAFVGGKNLGFHLSQNLKEVQLWCTLKASLLAAKWKSKKNRIHAVRCNWANFSPFFIFINLKNHIFEP